MLMRTGGLPGRTSAPPTAARLDPIEPNSADVESENALLEQVPDDVKFNYNGKCWWCGGQADSREHKYKRSDLVREFGGGTWSRERAVVRVVNGRMQEIQGSQSKFMKFEKSLCASCNNSRSQKFDLAYDKFAAFVKKGEVDLFTRRTIDFADVYGDDWSLDRRSMERFYVKHICCRMAESGINIPSELCSYMDDLSYRLPPYLTLKMEAREDIIELLSVGRGEGGGIGALWLGDMYASYSPSRKRITEAYSFIGYRWIRMNYWFDSNARRGRSNFDQQILRLPSGRNVPEGEVRRHSGGQE